MHAFLVLIALGSTLVAPLAPPASAGDVQDPVRHEVPPLADFARAPAPVGHEGTFLDVLIHALPPGARWERDAFGSVLVRLDGGPLRLADGPTTHAPHLLVAVGVDESCFVVSRIRDDGWLRLRALGDLPPGGDHLLAEGRPARVWTRGGPVPGVVTVDSIHLRSPRPEMLDESQLWLDVGADSAADVAALGIELLDPVEQHEVVAFGKGAVAGPGLGRRAAAHALLERMHALPAEAVKGVAFAFVAQSRPGSGALGRGGEAVARRLRPASVLALDAGEDLDMATRRRGGSDDGRPTTTLELRVAHEGTPVESVSEADRAAFAAALLGEFTGGPTANPRAPATTPPASVPAPAVVPAVAPAAAPGDASPAEGSP